MNERIDDLYKQARLDAGYEKGFEATVQDVYQRFAQLIVQECIDIIAPYTVRMSRPGEEYLHPILEIKQHFGVEE